MAIIVPTLVELYNSILSDLKNKLGIESISGKTVISAFAMVQAAKLKLQYITIHKVNQNVYPDLCDEETLRRFGRIRLGRDIRPAIAGEYTVTITGEVGAVISASTTLSNANGYLFILDTEFTFTSEIGVIQVRALTPGNESALTVGQQLQFTSPLANVDSFGTVESVVVIPSIAETVEEYRVNVIASYRLLPQGGSRADYRTWTENVPGVREVYPYAKSFSMGEINLYIEAFLGDSVDGNGTPPPSILLAVEDAIEPDKIPLGVYKINYLPINAEPIDVEISGISDITKISDIKNAISKILYEKRPFIAGADISKDINKGRLYASEIFQAVLSAGVSFSDITCKRSNNLFSSTEFTYGDIPFINDVIAI